MITLEMTKIIWLITDNEEVGPMYGSKICPYGLGVYI